MSRESVVLYAIGVLAVALRDGPQYEYIWEVDDVIQIQAARFVTVFNDLFKESLPQPISQNAGAFWSGEDWGIVGRCVGLVIDASVGPNRHYHWAIGRGSIVRFFWDTDVWTAEQYRRGCHGTLARKLRKAWGRLKRK